jgi:catechol 2,3-dioxygenase-like lactoylglutathione lyase family enzyme
VFDHVTIRVADRAASERFYDTVLPVLGIEKTTSDERFPEWGAFSIAQAGAAPGPTKRLHVAFAAPSRAEVDEFWRAGIAAGYPDDGAAGPRPEYGPDYDGAFLLDPDGNSAEAVRHGTTDSGATIDHLWIRVADVAASKRFCELIAGHAGFELGDDTPGRAPVRPPSRRLLGRGQAADREPARGVSRR